MKQELTEQLQQIAGQYNQKHEAGQLTARDARQHKDSCIGALTNRMQALDRNDAEYKECAFLLNALRNGWLVSDLDTLGALYQGVQKAPEGQYRKDGEAYLHQISTVKMDTIVDRFETTLRLIEYMSEYKSYAPQELKPELNQTYKSLTGLRAKRIYPDEYPEDRNFAATAGLQDPTVGAVYNDIANDDQRSRQFRQAVQARQRSTADYVIEERSESALEADRQAKAKNSLGHRLFGGINKKASTTILDAFGSAAYDEINEMYRGSIDERKVPLHHSLGTKFQKQGHDVLEMEFAGSGGQDAYRPHKNRLGTIDLKGKTEQDIQDVWGTKAPKPGGGSYDYIWKKERTLDLPNNQSAQKLRYTFAGASPTMLGGLPNFGEYSIQSSRDNARRFAAEFLGERFESWLNGTAPKPIHIELSGHSRGAVTAGQAAVEIDKWVSEYIAAHPAAANFKNFVNYDVILRDPVPGLGTEATIGDCDLRNIPNMNVLTFCSLGIQVADKLFPLEHIRGSKKLILNMENHQMDLEKTDSSQSKVFGNDKAGHMVSYFEPETGEMHRGTGLSELPDGVYVADEKFKLVRVDSYSQVVNLYQSAFEKSFSQASRSRRIHKMVRDWFCENELQMSYPDERSYRAAELKNKSIENKLLGVKSSRLAEIQKDIQGMQQMKAQPNMPREAIAEMNKILIQDCREYMKKTRMPPSGDSAFKAGLVGDLMSFAMRENNQIAKELNLVPANEPRAVLDAKIRAQRERLERKEGYLERKQEAERQRLQKEKDIRTVIRNTKQLSNEYLNSLTQIGAFKRKNQKLKDILAEGAKLGDHTSAREIGDYLKRFNNMVKGEDYPTLTRFGSMAEKSLKALVTDKADLDIGIGARIETREGELAYLESRQQALAGPQNQPVNAAQQPNQPQANQPQPQANQPQQPQANQPQPQANQPQQPQPQPQPGAHL